VPKLLDFGMAKLLSESPVHTVSGTPIGTPLYMSPEQARGEKVDQRSDVYALGVLCYEMLTGHLPFVGDTTVAVLMAHIIQAAPRASEACPEVSPLLDAPLLSMLEKDPNARPSGAGLAMAALRRAAVESGVTIPDTPLRLPRPAPNVSGKQLPDEPDTLLDDFGETEPDPAPTASIGPAARPLWPFGLGLLALGALLGFAVLRGAASTPEPEPRSSPPAPARSASLAPPPPVPAPAPPLASASSATAQPSAAPSSTPNLPARAPDSKRAKPRASASAHIPTDLENPF
jgi:serine/threonine-protein kinase